MLSFIISYFLISETLIGLLSSRRGDEGGEGRKREKGGRRRRKREYEGVRGRKREAEGGRGRKG